MSKTPGKSSVKRHITHTEASRQCQSLFFFGGRGGERVCAGVFCWRKVQTACRTAKNRFRDRHFHVLRKEASDKVGTTISITSFMRE